MTKFYIVNLNELTSIAKCSSKVTFAIILPMWKASSSAWEKISGNVQSILELCFKSSVIDVYSLQSRGSDDVEDLCVDELGFFDLPIIIGLEPRSAKVVYKSLLEDSLATGSLVYFLKRLPSQRILEPLSLTDIIRTFFSNPELSLGTIFLSGDRSSVGKSSISYGILSSLLYYGVPPDRLAYIKPVTQCEAEQLVTRYCREVGIATEAVSPVVFYKGFTRAFLQGNTDNASILISQVVGSVSMIGQGKTLVVVDGVGYPSVGSICNISNAHVAQALSSPVLLVGKSGVGDAIDSHNINSTYFQSFGVTVLGAVFNKFPLEGFYNIDSCRESISSYFEQFKRDQAVYGYLPQVEVDVG